MTPPSRLCTAYIALGANLGDPQRMLADTVRQLRRLHAASPTEGVTGTPFAVSALYRSEPFQADGPDYYNAAVRLQTGLSPEALLECLQSLENAGGRVRSTINAPRTLDLDLLLHGDERRQSPQLTLPHPRMHERAFVLRPLLDLGAGDLQIPGVGSVAGCEALTRDQRIEKMPSPWAE